MKGGGKKIEISFELMDFSQKSSTRIVTKMKKTPGKQKGNPKEKKRGHPK